MFYAIALNFFLSHPLLPLPQPSPRYLYDPTAVAEAMEKEEQSRTARCMVMVEMHSDG